jgi:hypothetical protein
MKITTHRFAGPLAVLGLTLVSCGGSSSGSGSPSDLDRFLGTWSVSSGMVMGSCTGLPVPFSMPLMGEQTVEKGTDSDLAFNVQPKCKLLLDVKGDVATVRPKQACTVSAGGTEVPGTVNSGNLTINGESATFTFAGDAALGPAKCTFTANGASTRIAAP